MPKNIDNIILKIHLVIPMPVTTTPMKSIVRHNWMETYDMSIDIDTGGPVFPIDRDTVNLGMTLRDYFAAKALQAMMTRDVMHGVKYSGFCREAYRMADEMLKAREQ